MLLIEEERALERRPDVRAWIDERTDEMAELLEELVAVPTENPPGRELSHCAQVLHRAMERLDLSPGLIRPDVTGSLRDPVVVRGGVGDGGGIVYFHGHYDVVPAQSRTQFSPVRSDGRIVGRGTADMKGGLVSMLYGAAAAAEFGLLSRRSIVLHFVCDEETGSAVGAGHLRRAGLIDPRALAMLTAEPTGGTIWHACRGAITLRVDVSGREAHVGYAHEGVNAFEHLMRIARPLVELSHELQASRTNFPVATPEAGGSMLVVGGQVGAGAGFNVVPGSAWFSVDRRFNPEENLDKELARLTDTIEQAAEQAGVNYEIEVLQRQPSGSTELTQPAARALGECVRSVQDVEPVFELCPGVLETRWYSQLGIPAFAFGGGRLDVSHGPDEYIEEVAMRSCAEVYASFASHVTR